MSVPAQDTLLFRRVESPTGVGNIVNRFEIDGKENRDKSAKKSAKGPFQRTGSFKNRHKIKQELENMSVSVRNANHGRFWRTRYFGHYDLQSVTVDRLSYQIQQSDAEHRLKKPTGASAAQLGAEMDDDDVSNDLVASCPTFKNEIGGEWMPKGFLGRLRDTLSQEKKMRLCSRERVVLDGVFQSKDEILEIQGSGFVGEVFTIQTGLTFPMEFIDFGACYYRKFFFDKDHQNFVGVDDTLGPIVASLRREKVSDDTITSVSQWSQQPPPDRIVSKWQFRVILRTSELQTLRGTILEEAIPTTTNKIGSVKGVPPREVLDYITSGELPTSCLKLAKQDEKVSRELLRLDEQELNNRYKIGVIYCKPGQTNEEDWYNNEKGSQAFDEFLSLLGKRVKMKGFTKYRAQLDNRTNTTGEFSVYSEFEDTEMMFHVSTLLPFTQNNRQQLLRKRHIGNDIVTIIFQEPGSEPFSPKTIRSHFQHIFVVVRVENPNTPFTEYRVSVTRSADVPYFGPPIPESGIFQKSEKFRKFLLTKLINACNAGLHSEKLYAMASRTRRQYLTDLCKDYATSASLDQVGGGGLGRLFSRRRERLTHSSTIPFTAGALTWSVSVIMRHCKPLPFSEEHDDAFDVTLCLAPDVLIFVDDNKVAILHIPTKDISGFCQDKSRLNLFYDNCNCISLECLESEEDFQDLCKRLLVITPAQEGILLDFTRSRMSGLLGFTIDQDGAVVKVDGLAKMTGLQKGARVLQVEDKIVSAHSHQEIVDLLQDRKRPSVKAFVIPPIPKLERPALVTGGIDWSGVWAVRPAPIGENDNESAESSMKNSPNVSNNRHNHIMASEGSTAVHLRTQRDANVKMREHHGNERRRKNRPDNLLAPELFDVKEVEPYDDATPIYDRLMAYNQSREVTPGPTSPSAKSTTGSIGPSSPVPPGRATYSRVKVPSKAVRTSVMLLANSIMDQGGPDDLWPPQPAGHSIDEYTPQVETRVSSSTTLPDRRHTASPLTVLRRPKDPAALGERNPDALPHAGQVHELTKHFTAIQSPPAGSPHRKSSTSPRRSRAGSRNSSHVPIIVGQDIHPILSDTNEQKRRSVTRPRSWDYVPDDQQNEPVVETSNGEADTMTQRDSFKRNSQVRTPFRMKPMPSPTHSEPMEAEVVPMLNGDDTGIEETKILDDVLEQYIGEGSPSATAASKPAISEEKVSKMSVKDRTQLWEMRAYYQSLPRSFKHRTKSQPCSPLKTSNPKLHNFDMADGHMVISSSSAENFKARHSVHSMAPDHSMSKEPTLVLDSVPRIRGNTQLSGVGGRHTGNLYSKGSILPSKAQFGHGVPRTRRSCSPTLIDDTASEPHHTASHHYPKHHSTSAVGVSHSKNYAAQNRRLAAQRSSDACVASPRSQSEKHFRFDTEDISQVETKPNEELIPYCRNIAQWVKDTENAGAPDGHCSPGGLPASPTCTYSDNFSFSMTGEKVEVLQNRIEQLESKLEMESENNQELHQQLRQIEKQIQQLQRKRVDS